MLSARRRYSQCDLGCGGYTFGCLCVPVKDGIAKRVHIGSGGAAFTAADLEGVLDQGGHSEQQRKDALGSIQKLLGPTGSLELRAYIQVTRKPSTYHHAVTNSHKLCQMHRSVGICSGD